MPAPSNDQITQLAQSFLSGAATRTGSEAAGYFLTLLPGGGGGSIAGRLDAIEAKIDELRRELAEDTQKIIDITTWNSLVNTLREPVAYIDSKILDLRSGNTTPAALQSYIDSEVRLTQIYQAVTPSPVDPRGVGLLSQLVKLLLPGVLAKRDAGAEGGYRRFVLPPLFDAHGIVQRYFHYLVGEQTRAITLVTNGDTFQHIDTATHVDAFKRYIKEECAAFQSAIELLVASYCPDLSLFGLFSSPHFNDHPLANADAYIAQLLSQAQWVFFRIWNGRAGGNFPFATGPSVQGQPALDLRLLPKSGASPVAPLVSSDSIFAASGTIDATPWTMLRFGMSVPLPPAGQIYSWQLDPAPQATAYYNCTLHSAWPAYAGSFEYQHVGPGDFSPSITNTLTNRAW